MSVIYQTTLMPSKYELLAAWLPAQPWFHGDVSRLKAVGAYRFDDPEGEVGCEGHLFTAGDDTVYHVPLTYRGAALEGAEAFVIGTTEHGVLGIRWVFDAVGDPVYRAALAEAIARGGTGSPEFTVDAAGVKSERTPSVRVAGTGSPGLPVPELWAAQVEQRGVASVAYTQLVELALYRVIDVALDGGEDAVGAHTLRGAWGTAMATSDGLDVAFAKPRVGTLLAVLRV